MSNNHGNLSEVRITETSVMPSAPAITPTNEVPFGSMGDPMSQPQPLYTLPITMRPPPYSVQPPPYTVSVHETAWQSTAEPQITYIVQSTLKPEECSSRRCLYSITVRIIVALIIVGIFSAIVSSVNRQRKIEQQMSHH